ncbi:methionyl aminopeptidase, partial [Phenoliferia sp. Uapishka_3]
MSNSQIADPFHVSFFFVLNSAKDAFAGKDVYTGTLRAVYPVEPVPKREVPESIPKPDYAINGELLLSIPDRWSGVWGGNIWGKAEEVGRVVVGGLNEVRKERANPKFGRVHTKEEIASMRVVCKLAREVLDITAAAIRPGVTTLELDEICHAECMKRQSYPSPLGYRLFPRSVCTSVNEVICHGIPDARPLEDGDIINLDVTLFYKGFHGDVNATYPVGPNCSEQNLRLIATTRSCLDEAIRAVKPGALFKDMGGIIEPIARKEGFSTNRTYVGHGINQLFHCAPNIAHYANSKSTVGQMKAGMIFTIEPMICTGNQQDLHWPDNWTAVTQDGKPSAQFEETMLVTATGVEVLTAAPGWELPPMPVKESSLFGSKGKGKA